VIVVERVRVGFDDVIFVVIVVVAVFAVAVVDTAAVTVADADTIPFLLGIFPGDVSVISRVEAGHDDTEPQPSPIRTERA
jgi:hypothetical protein